MSSRRRPDPDRRSSARLPHLDRPSPLGAAGGEPGPVGGTHRRGHPVVVVAEGHVGVEHGFATSVLEEYVDRYVAADVFRTPAASVVLHRHGHDIGPREQAALGALRPHLTNLLARHLAGVPQAREIAQLTARERAVAELVAAGWSNREIASHLLLSETR